MENIMGIEGISEILSFRHLGVGSDLCAEKRAG